MKKTMMIINKGVVCFMKKKKLNKLAIISFTTLSIIFYAIAIVCLIKGNKSVAISCLCLGSANLCFSSIFINIDNNK